MSTFGPYQTEAQRDFEGFVWTARKDGDTAAKYFLKLRRFADDDFASFTTTDLRHEAQLLKYISAKSGAWAKVLDMGSTDEAFYYVTRLYPHAANVLLDRSGIDAAILDKLISVVTGAVKEYREITGRAHGNLKPTKMLMTTLLAKDIAGAEMVLTAPSPDLSQDVAKAATADRQALGRLVYELVNQGEYKEYLWPLRDSEAWRALGEPAGRLLKTCNDLLNPSVEPVAAPRQAKSIMELLAQLEVMPAEPAKAAAAATPVPVAVPPPAIRPEPVVKPPVAPVAPVILARPVMMPTPVTPPVAPAPVLAARVLAPPVFPPAIVAAPPAPPPPTVAPVLVPPAPAKPALVPEIPVVSPKPPVRPIEKPPTSPPVTKPGLPWLKLGIVVVLLAGMITAAIIYLGKVDPNTAIEKEIRQTAEYINTQFQEKGSSLEDGIHVEAVKIHDDVPKYTANLESRDRATLQAYLDSLNNSKKRLDELLDKQQTIGQIKQTADEITKLYSGDGTALKDSDKHRADEIVQNDIPQYDSANLEAKDPLTLGVYKTNLGQDRDWLGQAISQQRKQARDDIGKAAQEINSYQADVAALTEGGKEKEAAKAYLSDASQCVEKAKSDSLRTLNECRDAIVKDDTDLKQMISAATAAIAAQTKAIAMQKEAINTQLQDTAKAITAYKPDIAVLPDDGRAVANRCLDDADRLAKIPPSESLANFSGNLARLQQDRDNLTAVINQQKALISSDLRTCAGQIKTKIGTFPDATQKTGDVASWASDAQQCAALSGAESLATLKDNLGKLTGDLAKLNAFVPAGDPATVAIRRIQDSLQSIKGDSFDSLKANEENIEKNLKDAMDSHVDGDDKLKPLLAVAKFDIALYNLSQVAANHGDWNAGLKEFDNQVNALTDDAVATQVQKVDSAVKDYLKPVPPPAAATLPPQFTSVPGQDDVVKISFSGAVARSKVKTYELYFRKVVPGNGQIAPFYLGATVMPVGLFIDVVENNGKQAKAKALVLMNVGDDPRAISPWTKANDWIDLAPHGGWLKNSSLGNLQTLLEPETKASAYSPMQCVTPAAAEYAATLLNCRLPTKDEYEWIANASLRNDAAVAGLVDADENLRGAKFADYAAKAKAGLYEEPLQNSVLTEIGLDLTLTDLTVANGPANDFVFFRDAKPTPDNKFRDLRGNVRQWVRIGKNAGPGVIGWSTLTKDQDNKKKVETTYKAAKEDDRFCDVGFRLAFDVPAPAPPVATTKPLLPGTLAGLLLPFPP